MVRVTDVEKHYHLSEDRSTEMSHAKYGTVRIFKSNTSIVHDAEEACPGDGSDVLALFFRHMTVAQNFVRFSPMYREAIVNRKALFLESSIQNHYASEHMDSHPLL